MRRFLVAAALALTALSCQKPLFDTPPRWLRERPRNNVKLPEPDSSAMDLPPRPGVYVTAIRFPEWADWRSGDFREAEALLLRDSVIIATAPAGPRPDPDRIRQWDGHLWTDIADAGTTTIYKDGKEFLSFEGEELFRGFLIENGNIHTLGQRPGGGGLCYRINGEEVFSSSAGSVLGSPSDREWEGGALTRDTTGVYFTYSIPVKKSGSLSYEYHVMKGADEIMCVSPSAGGGAIYDIRVRDGTVFRSERRNSGSQSLCLVMNDMFLSIDVGPEEDIHTCKLVRYKGEMAIKGYSDVDKPFHWIRFRNGNSITDSTPFIYDLYYDGYMTAVVTVQGGLVSMILKDHRFHTVEPMKYRMTSSRCADLKEGFFAVALSRAEGSNHMLSLNGEQVFIPFNGYFTSLKII